MRTVLTNRYALLAGLIAVFLISVAIRVPLLNQAVGSNDGNATAHVLTVLQIWSEVPVSVHKWGMIITYPGAANANMPDPFTAPVWDAQGRGFYVSFPPMAFYMPAAVFAVLGAAPTMFNLELFALGLHMVAGLGIFFLCRLLLIRDDAQNRDVNWSLTAPENVGALVAFCTFMLLPLNLKNQSYIYFSQTAVIPIWIWGIYWYTVTQQAGSGRGALAVLAGLVIFGCLTDWLGYLFAGSLLLTGVLLRPRHRWSIILAACAGTLVAALVHAMIFMQVADIAVIGSRLWARIAYWQAPGGTLTTTATPTQAQPGGSPGLMGGIVRLLAFSTLGIAPAVSWFLVFLKRPAIDAGTLRGMWTRRDIAMIIGLPILVDFAVLWNHNVAHDLSLVKLTVPLCLALGCIYAALGRAHTESTLALPRLAPLALGLLVLLSVGSLYFRASTFEKNKICRYFPLDCERGISLDRWEKMGRFIAATAQPDEAVFVIRKPEYYLQLNTASTYYSRRNYMVIDAIAEARRFLADHRLARGIIFDFSTTPYSFEKIEGPPVSR
jgi:hypothetical protein